MCQKVFEEFVFEKKEAEKVKTRVSIRRKFPVLAAKIVFVMKNELMSPFDSILKEHFKLDFVFPPPSANPRWWRRILEESR